MTDKEYIDSILDLLYDNTIVEDNKLRIKNKIKYDIYNLTNEYNPRYIDGLEKDMEYDIDE